MFLIYADNTAIVTTGDGPETVASNLETALVISHDWMNENKLSRNLSKTKVKFPGTSRKMQEASNIEVKCNGEIVSKTDCFKYLGIMVDKNLKFCDHIEYTKKKLFAKMKSLARVRQFVSRGLALQLYQSLIIPHIDYSDIVYDAIGAVDSQKLQTIKNQCLRICCNADPRTPINELHADFKLPKLHTHRRLHVCSFAYAGMKGESSSKVNSLFETVTNEHGRATRSCNNNVLKVPGVRLKTCAQNVKIRGAKYFNSLSVDIRNAPSTNCLKSRAKNHLYGILE